MHFNSEKAHNPAVKLGTLILIIHLRPSIYARQREFNRSWELLHSRHAIYRLLSLALALICLSLVPSGPMRVSARTDRLNKTNKHNNKQTNKQTLIVWIDNYSTRVTLSVVKSL